MGVKCSSCRVRGQKSKLSYRYAELGAAWTVACQVALFMGFSQQEYWSGLPCPPPEDLPNPGTELKSPALQADPLLSETPGKPQKYSIQYTVVQYKSW